MEELSQDYRYETWQHHTQQALSKLGLNIRDCFSDRAKALVKLALDELGCPSIAALFHALRELSPGLGSERSARLFRVHRRFRALDNTTANAALKQQLPVQQSGLEKAQAQ